MFRRCATIVALAIVLVAACAENEADDEATVVDTASNTTAPAASAAPAGVNACEVLSAEELKSVADIEGTGSRSQSGGADVCSWFGGNGSVVLQVYPWESAYEDSRRAFQDLYGTTAEDISGVGDKAFYMTGKTSRIDTGTLSAQKGTQVISVQALGGDASTHRDRVTALARAVLAKF